MAWVLGLMVAGAWPSAARASADDGPLDALSLEELSKLQVYTASKFVQKLSEAPSSAVVVTAADIRTFGYRKLIDILRSIPGVYGTYDRNYDYVGVRGFARPGDFNSRVLLLVDGTRFNENVFGQAAVGTEFPIDVDLIERVEFVPGPGSSIYGNNAFFGVINVITKRGADLRGAEVSAAVLSDDGRQARASYGARLDNGLDLIASATYYERRGEDLSFPVYAVPGVSDGIAHGLDYDRSTQLFLKAAVGGFRAKLAYGERKKGIPTGAYGTAFDDPRTWSTDEQLFIDAQYELPLARDIDLEVRAYFAQNNYDGRFPYRPADGAPAIENFDGSRGKWGGVELKAVQTTFARHKLVYGVTYDHDFEQRQFNYDNDPYVLYADTRPTGYAAGLYVQDEITLREGLLLNAGLRYDYTHNVRGVLSPRLGLIYSPRSETTFKLLYGSAFRAPNAYELYNTQADWRGNPALDHEGIRTYEALVEHAFARHMRVTASAFAYQVYDLINQATDPQTGYIAFDQVSRVSARGAQAVAELGAAAGVHGRASYTVQRVRDASTGERLTNSPASLAQVSVAAPVPALHLIAGLEARYTGTRQTLRASVPGYAVTDVTLRSQELVRGLEVSFSVYNVFDRRYADPTSEDLAHIGLDAIPQDGRSFRLKLTYRF